MEEKRAKKARPLGGATVAVKLSADHVASRYSRCFGLGGSCGTALWGQTPEWQVGVLPTGLQTARPAWRERRRASFNCATTETRHDLFSPDPPAIRLKYRFCFGPVSQWTTVTARLAHVWSPCFCPWSSVWSSATAEALVCCVTCVTA